MDRKYYIPHVWEREREVWEDVHLLPAGGSPNGPALWLTIDALGNSGDPEHGSERAEFQAEALIKLGDRPFVIDGTDMLVNREDFNKPELLDWVRIWLRENRIPVERLLEGIEDDFTGRSSQVDLVRALKQAKYDYGPDSNPRGSDS